MITAAPLVAVTLRGLLGRRRTLLMTLFAALPILVALLIRIFGGRPDAELVLDAMIVQIVLPLVALVFGTAALGSEIEDGTAVYLLAKPIPRWRIMVSKMAVAAGLTAALVVPATVFASVISRGSTETTIGFAVAVAIGGIAYACGFAALSAYTGRALVAGLVYTLLWEGALSGLLEGTRFLSVRQATLGIAAELSGTRSSPPPLEVGTSVVMLALVIGGAALLGTFKLMRFEVRGGD